MPHTGSSVRRATTPRRLALAVVAFALLWSVVSCRASDGGPSSDQRSTDIAVLQPEIADAMGAVTSVQFAVDNSGATVYIDSAGTMSLIGLDGRFQAPNDADAVLEIEVLGSLQTQIGAVALDGETWMSNPVTGKFEPLPAGIDVDPSQFFDPAGAWKPLVANATDMAFVGTEDLDGSDAYHLTGVGQDADVSRVTSGLVSGENVDFDMWVDPATAEVRRLTFSTTVGGSPSDWVIDLSDYGASFDITDPTTTDG